MYVSRLCWLTLVSFLFRVLDGCIDSILVVVVALGVGFELVLSIFLVDRLVCLIIQRHRRCGCDLRRCLAKARNMSMP